MQDPIDAPNSAPSDFLGARERVGFQRAAQRLHQRVAKTWSASPSFPPAPENDAQPPYAVAGPNLPAQAAEKYDHWPTAGLFFALHGELALAAAFFLSAKRCYAQLPAAPWLTFYCGRGLELAIMEAIADPAVFWVVYHGSQLTAALLKMNQV